MNTLQRFHRHLAAALIAFSLCGEAFAQANANPPERMTYQGFLVDANGLALGATRPQNYDVVFRVWTAQTGGTRLWSEQQTVTVDKGYFNVLLGEGSVVSGETRPDLSAVFSGTDVSERYVSVTVRAPALGSTDVEIAPRLRLLTSPFSFLARRAVSVVNASGTPLIQGNGAALQIVGPVQSAGGNNRGDGATELQMSRSSADRVASGLASAIGGGANNAAVGAYSTVSGGYSSVAPGDFSVVSGGNGNTASGRSATVSGGDSNQATGPYSRIGGGAQNTATVDFAAVGGGQQNAVSGRYATIGGGQLNSVSGDNSVVGGGIRNAVSSDTATVAGGQSNTASASGSAVGGGTSNLASGQNSAVPGGSGNRATGVNSFASGQSSEANAQLAFASGRAAKANHAGSFVWADASSTDDFASSANNEVSFRANGGFRVFGSAAVSGNVTAAGAVNAAAFNGAGTIPVGGIIMWSGSIANIPAGWSLCDGANNTPDLRSRFVVGASGAAGPAGLTRYDPNNNGGAEYRTLTVGQLPPHNHGYNDIYYSEVDAGNQGWRGSHGSDWDNGPLTTYRYTDNAGSGQAIDFRPPYYALAFIMRTR